MGCSIDRNHDHLQSVVDDATRIDGARRSNCHVAAAPHFADHRPWVFESVRILSVSQGCALNICSYFVPIRRAESSANIDSKSATGFRETRLCLHRFARSTRDLLNTLEQVADKGAGFSSVADAWADTTTSHERLMLTVLGGLIQGDALQVPCLIVCD
jgi:Resolvase, N terminal domain